MSTHVTKVWWDGEKLMVEPIPESEIYKEPAQQEPIYQCQDSTGKWTDQAKHSYDYNVKHGSATVRVVYLAPQPAQRKPLTLEEIENIIPDDDTPMSLGEAFVKFARVIEAAHGIKT